MRKYVAMIGAMVLTVGTVAAQTEYPRYGAYLGYDYTRFASGNQIAGTNLNPSFSAHGGLGEFLFNFNGRITGVVDAGAVHRGNIGIFGTNLPLLPPGDAIPNPFFVDATVAHFMAGPRINILRWKRFTPFVQTLFGGAWLGNSTAVSGVVVSPVALANGQTIKLNPRMETPETIITSRIRSSQAGFAFTAGGGLDIRFKHHYAFRPFQVEYFQTRFKRFRSPVDTFQDNVRASAGFMFLFGGERPAALPPPPPAAPRTHTCWNGQVLPLGTPCPRRDMTVSLAAANREICPGDSTQITATVSGPTGQTFLEWKVNGQPMGQSPNFVFSAAGRDPGTYTIQVIASAEGFNPTTAETTVTVLEYKPPTGSVTAVPSMIQAGDRSNLSATFTGQCGGPISAPTFEASEGSIVGNQFDSSTMRWDTASGTEQRRTVTITAKAADSRSVGTATTTVDVVKPPSAAAVRLPDVLFDFNSPRVNNCGKRILLEQLRAYWERDPQGTVYLVGHQSSDERAPNLASKRAMNAAAVISNNAGVCLSIPASQVQISSPGVDQGGVPFEAGFCRGSVKGGATAAELRRVEVWFVPAGAKAPPSAMNSQTAAALGVASLGCPK